MQESYVNHAHHTHQQARDVLEVLLQFDAEDPLYKMKEAMLE